MTLDAWAPLMRSTLLADAVMSVDAALKMKTAFGSPWASRVSVPVIPNVPAGDAYTPGVSVVPPSSTGILAVTGLAAAALYARPRPGLAAAALYAVVRSFWACNAALSAALIVPITCPGGNPVIAVPGLSPRSPVIVVGPLLATVH